MTFPLALSPAAEDDLHHAAAWYDTQQLGLGDASLRSVEACFDRVQRLPEFAPLVESDIRSALLRRAVMFPNSS